MVDLNVVPGVHSSVVGDKAFVYATGTTTQVDCFLDADGTIPALQPFPIDPQAFRVFTEFDQTIDVVWLSGVRNLGVVIPAALQPPSGSGGSPKAWIGCHAANQSAGSLPDQATATFIPGDIYSEGTPGFSLGDDDQTWTCTEDGLYQVLFESNWSAPGDDFLAKLLPQLTVADANAPVNQWWSGQ